ncbi:glucose-6-phosphate isomerase [Pseudohaliea sp.]|uniref:glucose-6-phosphate isomerase n=1 Tax=Pseudohaliea sp. TaxID=2740289 RepID=UPI0032EDBEEA
MSRDSLTQGEAASNALTAHADRLRDGGLASLAAAPSRTDRLLREGAGLRLDASRQLLDGDALDDLVALAIAADLPGAARDLLAGAEVNNTEHRPALHSLLRASHSDDARFPAVAETRERMRDLAESIRAGAHTGHTGRAITDVVNIGIGGSDLGPRLVSEALAAPDTAPRAHYAANVDPDDLAATLAALDPATTLFVICSKSFRTEETLANALAARRWLRDGGVADSGLARHCLAITTNLEAAADFGIPESQCLPMWDWVGGRYSVWSAVGLSCATTLGWDRFAALLAGAEAMDAHFASAAPADNLPMLLALLETWNCQYLRAGNHVVLPYSHRLRRLPDFLQQLTMESNGKAVTRDGEPLGIDSAPVLWGSAGTIGQHSFHQLLHQGTRRCPADILLPLAPEDPADRENHARLVANGLAQSRALVIGRSEAEAREALLARGEDPAEADRLAPHLAMPGNRPHNLITFPRLTPETLGALLALYEHRTYCSAVLWNINAFDQWGVELGKEIGKQVFAVMQGDDDGADLDDGTLSLVELWKSANG